MDLGGHVLGTRPHGRDRVCINWEVSTQIVGIIFLFACELEGCDVSQNSEPEGYHTGFH